MFQLAAWLLTSGLLIWFLMLTLDSVRSVRVVNRALVTRDALLRAHAQRQGMALEFVMDGLVCRPVWC